MAVYLYTSLISLSNLLDNVFDRIEIQFPRLDAVPFDALRESVDSLLSILAAHSPRRTDELKALSIVISGCARRADDVIDAHVVDQLYKDSQEEETSIGHSTFAEKMDPLNQAIQMCKELLLSVIQEGEDEIKREHPEGSSSGHALWATSFESFRSKDEIVVGLDEKVIQIMEELTSREEADLQIITITGMGGIGKTTLAKTIYGHPLIVEHFDVRLWVVVSQRYVVEQVLQDLIDSGEKKFFSGHGGSGESSCELLGEKLYKGLFGRRYLVVMDDVWSTEVWDELKQFFPNNGNGSRIMMTSRDSLVASSLSSTSNINRLDFLDCDGSWELLCWKAFSQGDCPNQELEEVGRNIAEGCKGLPLSIVVIGSMLAGSKMTREYWEAVAEDVNSFRNLGDDGHCLEILSLSYNNLPIHLKACLIHTGMYRYGDGQISVDVLLTKWVADDFIISIEHKSLESVAEEYAMALVHRNLILVDDYFANGDVRTLRLHDLVRELCWREHDEELFQPFPRSQHFKITREAAEACFMCGFPFGVRLEDLIFPCRVLNPPSSPSQQVSYFMCERCAYDHQQYESPSLVRVMDNVEQYSCQEVVHATKTKDVNLAIPIDVMKFVSPSFVHLLWRLQVLIYVRVSDSTNPIVLPSEFWKMRQLRNVAISNAVLTYPAASHDTEQNDFIILKYLHTLGHIRNFICTAEVVCRVPNLKTLMISDPDDSWATDSLRNLADLHKLEHLEVDKPIFSSENISFPQALKKLSLKDTRIPWKDIGIIGSLPALEWLQLMNGACIGPDWDPVEGEFPQLKVLCIESSDLIHWRADNIHFPILESLTLGVMHQLAEIPSGIGDIPTLKVIFLHKCSNNVVNSAKQIWEEQQDYGNVMLKVGVEDGDGRYYKFGDEI